MFSTRSTGITLISVMLFACTQTPNVEEQIVASSATTRWLNNDQQKSMTQSRCPTTRVFARFI